jgi:hypothetical protein
MNFLARTRSASKYFKPANISVDEELSDETIQHWINIIESNLPQISDFYQNRIVGCPKTFELFKNNKQNTHITFSTNTSQDDDGEPFLSVRITFNSQVIYLYHYLKTKEIYSLVFRCIFDFAYSNFTNECLSLDEFNSLSSEFILNHKAPGGKDKIFCSISQENCRKGSKVSTLGCGHQFKSRVIKEWLTDHSPTCPLCRCCMRSDEQRIELAKSYTCNFIDDFLPNISDYLNNDDPYIRIS